ncbi:hypothetical protein SeMB42_g07323, partial [Synchytrium endobioticum]
IKPTWFNSITLVSQICANIMDKGERDTMKRRLAKLDRQKSSNKLDSHMDCSDPRYPIYLTGTHMINTICA